METCGQCGAPLAPIKEGLFGLVDIHGQPVLDEAGAPIMQSAPLACSNEDCAGPCPKCGGPRSDIDGDGLADCTNPRCAQTLRWVDWREVDIPELGGLTWVPHRLVPDVRPMGAPSGIVDRFGREVYVRQLADGRQSYSVPGMRLDLPAWRPAEYVLARFNEHSPEGWAPPEPAPAEEG